MHPAAELIPRVQTIDPEIEALVRQLLSKAPEDRPSASEATSRLRALAAKLTPSPQRTTPAPPRPAVIEEPVATKTWYANQQLASGALLGGLVVSLVTLLFGG